MAPPVAGFAAFIWTMASLMPMAPAAQNPNPATVSPLTGISGVAVKVALAVFGPTLESERRLQALVEDQLRSAGLQVLIVGEEVKGSAASPIVTVTINVITVPTAPDRATDVIRTELALTERSIRPRNGASVTTELWSRVVMAVRETRVGIPEQGHESTVTDLTDDFVKDWVKANPKK